MPRGMWAAPARQVVSSRGAAPMVATTWRQRVGMDAHLWGTDFDTGVSVSLRPGGSEREDPSAGGDIGRVVRGGSWDDHRRRRALCLPRQGSSRQPERNFGFRVVLRSAPVS